MAVAIPSARFVGREGEFVRLAELIDAVAAGTPRTLLLTGASGLGASRFLDEASARIARLPEPALVLRASASAARRGCPYEPIAMALWPALLGCSDGDLEAVVGPAGEVVARLLPGLGPRLRSLGLVPDQPRRLEPERRQVRVFEAVLGVLARLGERRPILLVVEDVHRADRATLGALAFLARVSRPRRVGLVATYEVGAVTADHPLHETLRAMADGPLPPTAVELAPLGRSELAQLIEAIEGERPTASVLLLVAERSGGNPLVAEELLMARRELSTASLTGSFEQLVVARLARRSSACRRLLQLVAAAGHPVTRAELAAIDAVAFADGAAARRSGTARRAAERRTAERRSTQGLSQELRAALEEAFATGELVERAELGVTVDVDAAPTGATAPADAPADRPSASEAASLLDLRHERIRRAVMADLLPDVRGRLRAAVAAAGVGGPAHAIGHWRAANRPLEARAAALLAAAEA
ncbi:MAG TPA: AAA family ATPase, partial [Candidatus Binatia bacterium]|nr:AAA family ATPase [Candidatus Binatia bacterium]